MALLTSPDHGFGRGFEHPEESPDHGTHLVGSTESVVSNMVLKFMIRAISQLPFVMSYEWLCEASQKSHQNKNLVHELLLPRPHFANMQCLTFIHHRTGERRQLWSDCSSVHSPDSFHLQTSTSNFIFDINPIDGSCWMSSRRLVSDLL
jgi:hypothetical protein